MDTGRPNDSRARRPRGGLRRLLRIRRGFLLGVAALVAVAWLWMVDMPGESHSGPLPPATPEQRRLEGVLRRHVTALGGEIGARSVSVPGGLERAAAYIEDELRAHGHAPRRLAFEAGGETVANIEVELPGTRAATEIVVVGAHYDGLLDRPAANDNGSGTAALLALAGRRGTAAGGRTLRLVFFANEEPPWFQTPRMGSLVYARACRERGDDVRVMWSLETLAWYSSERGSQKYPIPALRLFYPSRGDFVAFVGNTASRRLVRRSVALFRGRAAFPSEGAALPGIVPGVGWSDHWAFWQCGYPGVMITDTAPFRDPCYHGYEDLPERLDYASFARVVDGLALTLDALLE